MPCLLYTSGEDVVAGIRTPQGIEKMAEAFPDADVYKRQELSRVLENGEKLDRQKVLYICLLYTSINL